MIEDIKQYPKGTKAHYRHKKFGVSQSVFVIFFNVPKKENWSNSS